LVGSRIVCDLDRACEGGFGFVVAAELVEEDAAADVGGGETTIGLQHRVVDCERVFVTSRVDEEGREGELEGALVRSVAEAFAEGGLRARKITELVPREAERLPRLGVGGLERAGPREGIERGVGLVPPKESGAEDAVGVGALGCDLDRAAVRTQRGVVVALELVGERDLDDGARIGRTERGEACERGAGTLWAIGEELGARELEPARALLRLLGGGAGEAFGGFVEAAFGHRAATETHVAGGASEDEREEREECGARVRRSPRRSPRP
jgi:hypothetical protein